MSNFPKEPLKKIALCCSGGGYRASAFHLGTLSYLNRIQFAGKPLIQNIKTISTVSGGTITGVVYALKTQEGKSFEETYDFLLRLLRDYDLIKEGLELINGDIAWKNNTKRRNLINAFSILYDTHYTEGKTFKHFYDLKNAHLNHVIFNSTEFKNGLNFRFQNSGEFGNKVNKEVASAIKLGDIIAASSCFPGGFEPISFPSDFRHETSKKLLAYSADTKQNIGLMDGGIYDNQGIDSILKLENRSSFKELHDLILISDVSSPDIEEFEFYQASSDTSYSSLNYHKVKATVRSYLNSFNWLLAGLFILGLVLSAYKGFSNHFLTGLGLGILMVTLLFVLLYAVLTQKTTNLLDKTFQKIEGLIPAFYLKYFKALAIDSYPFGKIEEFLLNRLYSVKTLVGEVFMKQIRGLRYDQVYATDKYVFKRVSCLIKELTEADFKKKGNRIQNIKDCPKELKGGYQEVFSPAIKVLAEEAAAFGTTLWFTPKDKLDGVLDKLIACGQATTCYNLLGYLVRLMGAKNNEFDQLPIETQENLRQVFECCLEDWKEFKKDPQFLLKKPKAK